MFTDFIKMETENYNVNVNIFPYAELKAKYSAEACIESEHESLFINKDLSVILVKNQIEAFEFKSFKDYFQSIHYSGRLDFNKIKEAICDIIESQKLY